MDIKQCAEETVRQFIESKKNYLLFTELSYFKDKDIKVLHNCAVLCNLDIFIRFSGEAIKLSTKGHEMISEGYTNYDKYEKSKTKDKWRVPFFILAVLTFIVPSVQNFYYNNLSSQKETLQLKTDSLFLELKTQKALHKSFSDSVNSIDGLKDSLQY
jgi:hypothetical protein